MFFVFLFSVVFQFSDKLLINIYICFICTLPLSEIFVSYLYIAFEFGKVYVLVITTMDFPTDSRSLFAIPPSVRLASIISCLYVDGEFSLALREDVGEF